MSEQSALLRLLVNGDKEFKTTTLNVGSLTPTLFTSQLTVDYARKLVTFYNNSDATSGETMIGHSSAIFTGNSGENGYPLPIGAEITVPVFRKLNKVTGAEETLDIYLLCVSGEADIRVFEVA